MDYKLGTFIIEFQRQQTKLTPRETIEKVVKQYEDGISNSDTAILPLWIMWKKGMGYSSYAHCVYLASVAHSAITCLEDNGIINFSHSILDTEFSTQSVLYNIEANYPEVNKEYQEYLRLKAKYEGK